MHESEVVLITVGIESKVNLCVDLIRFIRSFYPFISLDPFSLRAKVLLEPSTFPYLFTFLHIPFGSLEPSNWRNTTCCLFTCHMFLCPTFYFIQNILLLWYSTYCIYIGLILLNKQLVSDLLPSRGPLQTSHLLTIDLPKKSKI